MARAASDHDAVFVGCGLERGLGLMVPGEDLPGVEDGLELLRKVAAGNAPALEGPIAVIGGGYTAIEAARCVVRLGGKALLIYRRRREDMPASREGIAMALEEGVEVRDRMTPVSIEAQGGEFLLTLREVPGAEPGPGPAAGDADGSTDAGPAAGKTETIPVSRIFKAGGLEAAEPWMLPPEDGEGVLRLNNSVLVLTAGRTEGLWGRSRIRLQERGSCRSLGKRSGHGPRSALAGRTRRHPARAQTLRGWPRPLPFDLKPI